MHYYPEDQSEENLEKIRRSNVCAECGRRLAVFFIIGDKRRYIACSGQVHEGIAREYKQPREDYQSNIRREMKLEDEHGRETAVALRDIPKQGQLTQPQATSVLNLIYPDATTIEIERCAIFCRDFGLHPLANEVYLIPFKGKNVMVVGIAANRKMAHALKGDFSFLDDTPRAASEEEIVKQYGKDSEEAEDNIISVTKLEGIGGNKAIGFGLWPKSDKPYGMDKGNSKRNMANIHSERQGIDRLPGKAIPQYEVVDTAYVEGIGDVDKKTGEIKKQAIEGEFREVEEEPTEPEVEQPATKSILDLEWLKETLTELQKKGIKAYSDESMLDYMKKIYKLEGKTIEEVASKLGKGEAAHLAKVLQDALDKA